MLITRGGRKRVGRGGEGSLVLFIKVVCSFIRVGYWVCCFIWLGCCSLLTIPTMTMTKNKGILRTNSKLECDWFVVRWELIRILKLIN